MAEGAQKDRGEPVADFEGSGFSCRPATAGETFESNAAAASTSPGAAGSSTAELSHPTQEEAQKEETEERAWASRAKRSAPAKTRHFTFVEEPVKKRPKKHHSKQNAGQPSGHGAH